jgi:hypothetical protein
MAMPFFNFGISLIGATTITEQTKRFSKTVAKQQF